MRIHEARACTNRCSLGSLIDTYSRSLITRGKQALQPAEYGFTFTPNLTPNQPKPRKTFFSEPQLRQLPLASSKISYSSRYLFRFSLSQLCARASLLSTSVTLALRKKKVQKFSRQRKRNGKFSLSENLRT